MVLAIATWQWAVIGILGVVLLALIATRVAQGKKNQG